MKKGRLVVCPGEVELTIHEPLPTAGVERNAVLAFAARVRQTVAQAAR
jgi:hypothetical protein